MKSLLKVCIIFFLLCLTAIPVYANWVEVESENFIFRGDLRESDAVKIVRELEGFRSNILGLLGVEAEPERVKVLIYAVKDDRTLRAVYGTDNVGGVYTSDLRGPVFLLNTSGGFTRKNTARYVAFHEYSHHLISAYTGNTYPLWYNEGFANFLATYEEKKGKFTIGSPRQEYGPALAERKFFKTRDLLLSIREYPFGFTSDRRSDEFTRTVYYGQSWLMVHHLQNTPEFTKNSSRYIAYLNAGMDPLESWDETMGVTPEEYDDILMSYYRKNRFSAFTVPSKVKLKDIKVTKRRLSDAQGLRYLADASLVFSSNDKNFERTLAAYEKAEKALGTTPEILIARADIAMANENYDQARLLIAKALEMSPGNLEAHRIGGANEIMAMQNGMGHENSLIDGRAHLRAVLKKDPDDPSANYFIVQSYAGGMNPPEEAVQAAEIVVGYYRDTHFSGRNLTAIGILLSSGKKESVRMPLRRAAVWAKDSYTRRQALSLYQEYFGQ